MLHLLGWCPRARWPKTLVSTPALATRGEEPTPVVDPPVPMRTSGTPGPSAGGLTGGAGWDRPPSGAAPTRPGPRTPADLGDPRVARLTHNAARPAGNNAFRLSGGLGL